MIFIAPVMAEDSSTEKVRLHPGHAGWRLDRALADALPAYSRERLKALIGAGAVTSRDGALRDPARKVAGDEEMLVVIPRPRPPHNEPQDIPLSIVHEDEHLLVVDKPAGLVVHPAAGNLDGTLVNALLHHCQGRLSGIGGVARPGIVHRIDKGTSGLLVVAKTDPTHEGLSRQFAAHSVERAYTAVVRGHPLPASGTVSGHLARSAVNRQKMAVVQAGRGKHSVTHYRTMDRLAGASVLECRLETGRTHQVRVHMASIGHPLIGDQVYGRAGRAHAAVLDQLTFVRQALHARTLGFEHPVTREQLRFESAVPDDIRELIRYLAVEG